MFKNILILQWLLLLSKVYGEVTICYKWKDNAEHIEQSPEDFEKTLNKKFNDILDDDSDSKFFEHVPFTFNHPALRASGEIDNVTLSNLRDYKLEGFKFLDNGDFLMFNVTYHNISAVGEYQLDGNIGELFDIFGNGSFWANMLNFSISATASSHFANWAMVCLDVDVKVELQNIENYFYNFMYDDELEKLLNVVVSDMVPEVIGVIWEEMKEGNHDSIEKWINSLINGDPSDTFSASLRSQIQGHLQTHHNRVA